ncbi:MAG: hypothetical protein H7123_05185 [Thermoleophilia bacterium]|nr:hypothetical protein [Thermoleophilia bacterium]
MTLGGSIFVLALGAILAFAVNVTQVGVIDVDTVGWILMTAGLLGLFMSMFVRNARAHTGGITLVERRDIGPRYPYDQFAPQVTLAPLVTPVPLVTTAPLVTPVPPAPHVLSARAHIERDGP